jgi:hypothetical protein
MACRCFETKRLELEGRIESFLPNREVAKLCGLRRHGRVGEEELVGFEISGSAESVQEAIPAATKCENPSRVEGRYPLGAERGWVA